MKRLKALPLIFYVLQTTPAYAAPTKEHFEILDMTNPAVIREMDRVYVMHPDQNSIQQGIRLYALAIQAWNPSYQNTDVRLKIMAHVKEQGVLNGLIAPSILLIEHALKTNDVAFAMSLITMVRHISPIFNSQLERKWKLPETSENFAKFVTNSDEQISKYYGRILGSDFQAYADGERKLAETSLRQSFMSSRNNETDLDSLIKKATSKPASRKTTAQDLVQNVVEKGPSKDAFAKETYKQCIQLSHLEDSSLEKNDQPTNKKESLLSDELKKLNNKCTAEVFQDRKISNIDLNAFTRKSWIDRSGCEDFLQQTKNAQNLLQNKIEQDRSRYSDVSWICLKECSNQAWDSGVKFAEAGVIVGAYIAKIPGAAIGSGIGAVAGATIGILACQETASCGGDKIQNEKDRLELEAARAKAETERLRLEIAKMERQKQIEKQKNDEQEKDAAQKQEREKALNDLGIKEDDIIKGVDFCSNSSCAPSSIVESDNSFNAQQRVLEKEELKKKRIKDYYARQNNAIETNPKSVQDLWDPSSIALKKCIKDEWNKELGNFGTKALYNETSEEKLKREKMEQEIENITNPNPWDIKSLYENGGN